MNFSNKTKKVIIRRSIQPNQDLYPDRSATDLTIKGDATLRLPLSEVPKTTEDVSKIMKWKHKDGEVKGTHAKEDKALQRYRDDINKAWGNEKNYKYYFIDTMSPVPFKEQFIEMKKGK